MTETGRGSRSWLKLGCLGVLGVAALLVVWAVALFGTASFRARNEVVRSQTLSRAIPGTRGVPSSLEASGPPVGRVVLDLTVGDFRVVRGEPGDPVRVEASFDRRSYVLRESFDPRKDTGWTYRVTFDEINWFKDGGLRALLGGSFPEIVVSLPPDVPLALEGTFGKGHAMFDLGGLWLTDIDLSFDQGAMVLKVDQPLVAPAERITIRSRQGGTFIRSLGNASPRSLEIDHRMGGLTVDLGGEWVRDAEIRIASSMGGARLTLPDGVTIEGLHDPPLAAAPAQLPEVPLPTLKLSLWPKEWTREGSDGQLSTWRDASPFGGGSTVAPSRSKALEGRKEDIGQHFEIVLPVQVGLKAYSYHFIFTATALHPKRTLWA